MEKKKILHIGDDENVRELAKIILKNYDYMGVSTAEEGLNIIKNNHFDLLILDLKLHCKMQGVDLLNKLNKLRIRIKIILLTASLINVRQLKKEYPELIVTCIMKPFDNSLFMKEVKDALSKN